MTKRPHAQAAQALMTARDGWLNPAELVQRVPEIVPGFPDRLLPKDPASKAVLCKRTLTAQYNQRGPPEGSLAGRAASRLGRGRRRCLWLARRPARR